MKREKSEEGLKTITMKWHLLSDPDREKVFENTDNQARSNSLFRRLFIWAWLLFAILSLLFAETYSRNEYITGGFVVFFLAFIFFNIYFRFQRVAVSKRRLENFDRLANQDFLFIEISVEKSFFYPADEHLGPYWLGFSGPDEALLLRGESLQAFLKGLRRSKVRIIVEHLGAVVDVEGHGPKIPMAAFKKASMGEALERLMIKKGLLDFLPLKGKRLRWLRKEMGE